MSVRILSPETISDFGSVGGVIRFLYFILCYSGHSGRIDGKTYNNQLLHSYINGGRMVGKKREIDDVPRIVLIIAGIYCRPGQCGVPEKKLSRQIFLLPSFCLLAKSLVCLVPRALWSRATTRRKSRTDKRRKRYNIIMRRPAMLVGRNGTNFTVIHFRFCRAHWF